MFYSALCCFTFRLPPESGQASGLHGADSGSREGSVQSSEDPQRHTQVWSHLPCLVSGSDHCQKQGKGAFKELKRGLKLAARVLWLESKHGFLCCVQISRMLAAKAALAIRYDALGEDTNAEMGAENRAKLEARLRQLEEKGVSTTGGHLIKRFHWPCLNWKTHSCWWGFIQRGIILILILVAPLQIRRISGTGKAMAKADKYQHKRWSVTFLKMRYFHLLLSQFLNTHVFPNSEVRMYDPSGDSTIPSTSRKRKIEEVEEEEAEEPVTPVVKSKKPKKETVTEGEWIWNTEEDPVFTSALSFMMLKVFCLLTSRSWNISSRRGNSQEKEEEEGQDGEGWSRGTKRRGGRGSSNRGKAWTDVRSILNTFDLFQTDSDFAVSPFVPVNRKEEKEEEKEGERGGRRLRGVENVYMFCFTWVI